MSHFLFTNLMRSGTLRPSTFGTDFIIMFFDFKTFKDGTIIYLHFYLLREYLKYSQSLPARLKANNNLQWQYQVIYFLLWSCYNSELINSKRFLFHFKSVIWINNYNFDVLYIIWWRRSDQYKWTLSSLNRSNFSVFNLCF